MKLTKKYSPRMVLSLAVLLCGSFSVSAQEGADDHFLPQRPPPPSLTVNGHAELSAPPDRAIVRLGAEAQANDADGAQSAVNASIGKAIEEIKKTGIAEKSLKTTGLNLEPIYSTPKPGQEAEPPKVVGYRASNTIEIQIDDLQLVGKVIDAGVSAGANRLDGVAFELHNDAPLRAEALSVAAQEAESKAHALAKALNINLLKIREVTEGAVNVLPRPMNYARSMMAGMAAQTPVHPGEIRVQASLTVRYEIGAVQK